MRGSQNIWDWHWLARCQPAGRSEGSGADSQQNVSTPTWLATIGTQGSQGLTIDAHGDLFGTTYQIRPPFPYGSVFEIAKTSSGYASTPTTLYTFCARAGCTDGVHPSGLVVDAQGNLFGMTAGGGAYGYGTVFEIANTANGYASTPTILVSFAGSNGANPLAGPIANANGTLFGTTNLGGAYGYGTVFALQTFAGLPGQRNCFSQSVSALARKYGGLNAAAATLNYASISALQNAIMAFCERSDQVASLSLSR
jgi:uncharacterized repeat protein (TIGR03803 family)